MVYSMIESPELESATMVRDDRRPVGPAQKLGKLRASPAVEISILKLLKIFYTSARSPQRGRAMRNRWGGVRGAMDGG